MFMRHRLAVAARFSSIPWITLRQESKQNTTCRHKPSPRSQNMFMRQRA